MQDLPLAERHARFAAFRADRAQRPIDGFALELEAGYSRHLPRAAGAEALICFTSLDAAALDSAIAAEQQRFAARRQRLEWKVYEFDEPASLREQLAAAGFIADEAEAFMLYPLDGAAPASGALPDGLTVRRLTRPEELAELIALQESVWSIDLAWLYSQMCERLAHSPERLSVYGAYAGTQLVGTGWTDFPTGSAFAELHGGAVLPAWRGRGVYRALLAPRVLEAQARGCNWLAVDAAPMSRPILEALGFQPVCLSWPMRWAPPA